MSDILELRRVNEGVEVVIEEERGFTKRRNVFSFVLKAKDIEKINNLFALQQKPYLKDGRSEK